MAWYVIYLAREREDELVYHHGHLDHLVSDSFNKIKQRRASKSSGLLRLPGM